MVNSGKRGMRVMGVEYLSFFFSFGSYNWELFCFGTTMESFFFFFFYNNVELCSEIILL